jgi:hypothetical protein
VLDIPRVDSRNAGNTLDEGVFDRVEIDLIEGLRVRGFRPCPLNDTTLSVEMDKLQRSYSYVGPLTIDLGQIQ